MEDFSLDEVKRFIDQNNSSDFYNYLIRHEENNNQKVLSWCLMYVLIKSSDSNREFFHLFCLVVSLLTLKNINSTINGRLPLEIAYTVNNLECYIHLLLNGADPQKKNSKFLSTYDIVLGDGNERFLDFILKYEKVLVYELQKRKNTR
ncbi:hypothetical protein ACSSUQ_004223 [Yersinia enterocolitica]